MVVKLSSAGDTVRPWRAEELLTWNNGYPWPSSFQTSFSSVPIVAGRHTPLQISGADGAVFKVLFIVLPSDATMIADSIETFVSGERLSPDFANE